MYTKEQREEEVCVCGEQRMDHDRHEGECVVEPCVCKAFVARVAISDIHGFTDVEKSMEARAVDAESQADEFAAELDRMRADIKVYEARLRDRDNRVQEMALREMALEAALREARLFAWSYIHDRCTTAYRRESPYCGTTVSSQDHDNCIEAQEIYRTIDAALSPAPAQPATAAKCRGCEIRIRHVCAATTSPAAPCDWCGMVGEHDKSACGLPKDAPDAVISSNRDRVERVVEAAQEMVKEIRAVENGYRPDGETTWVVLEDAVDALEALRSKEVK